MKAEDAEELVRGQVCESERPAGRPRRPAPPKIAIVSRSIAGVTGTTTTIIEHARRFRDRGWEVHVLGEKIDAGRLAQAGAQIHFIPRFPWGSYFKRRLFDWLLERELREERYDLVCGHGDNLRQDVLSLHNCVHAAHEAVHGTPLPASSGVGRIHRRILSEKRFRVLVANSELMRQDVIRRFGVEPEKVTVIHPGYDPARFKAEDRAALGAVRRTELGVKKAEVLVGLITSGDFAKRGVGLFLRALGRLTAASKGKIQVVVVGQETRLEPYRKQAAETGLGERIRFLPPSAQVERFYHALDIYVHPALFEEFGQSVQEAMACGVCVLTSKRVGAAELLQGEAQRMLLGEPKEDALTKALEELIVKDAKRRAWGEQAAAAVRSNTWDENFKKTLACYESLRTARR